MLSINASALRATLNEPGSPQGGHAAAPADPAGFASLLRQTQAATPMPAPAPIAAPPVPAAEHAALAPDDEAAAPDDAPEAADTKNRTRALPKSKLRNTDTAGTAQRNQKPGTDASDATAAADERAGVDKNGSTPASGQPATDVPIDPAIAQWLAAQPRAAAAPAPDARGSGTTATADETATALGEEAGNACRGAAHKARAAELKADAELKARAEPGKAALAAAADEGQFAAALAEQQITDTGPAPQTHALAGPKDAMAAFTPPASGPREAAAPVAVALPTPVNAPEFPQALGLQMSVLARDGVHEAELHLNPAEMGPVSVQIVMDGTQARVEFGADLAATRQAIEAGLPELASALRDAGFTLAGGGVSQHSRGRGEAGDGNERNGSAAGTRRAASAVDSDAASRIHTAARRIVSAGGVDLFA